MSTAPGPDHDGHGSCQPERARAGNDQNGHCVEQCVSQSWLRSRQSPGDEGNRGGGKDHGNEESRDPVG